jgi:hypothetical protein
VMSRSAWAKSRSLIVTSLVTQTLEHCQSVFVAANSLSINQTGNVA